MSAHIVIVHGLSSKPAPDVLFKRFHKHLSEGVGKPIPEDRLHLVYWADLMGHLPDTSDKDEYNENGNNFRPYSWRERFVALLSGKFRDHAIEPLENHISSYLRATKPALPGELADLFPDALRTAARHVYSDLLPDLRKYFIEGQRQPVKDRLLDKLDAVPDGAPVCLIGHSMGSIIALDVLLNDARKVDLFVTIGSPLGLHVIQEEIGVNSGNQRQLTQRMDAWHNFYDRLDIVALDADLNDDYDAVISDEPVRNTFIKKNGDRNPHKSYGYLRNHDVGEIVGSFLDQI